MADRFPSLDEIDAGQTEVKGGDASFDALADTTEPSDFLSRERALLGDDADQFSSPADTNLATTVQDGDDDDDLLGGDFQAAPPVHSGDDMGDFETSFPAIDTSNEAVAPGGTITGSALPLNPAFQSASPSYPQQEESEAIRAWRERRDLAIAHRDEVSASRKAETVKAAQQAIDDFYENYNNKKDKTIAQTRKEAEEFLAKREDTTAGGTSWERIAKLVDLSGKGAGGGAQGTGKAKFRELLVNLRKDEHAPGATGV